ncbi:hypothetical protein [Schumannella sp. 10F1B-5-1]|uniref:hypothetical protein n=1 Tax=Schumannella sp. 10F1B-5-1 TaxID=2590780 RepID=UPI0011306E14|nr:hypothetical protein [Schumannella sp. 10F1B-5-1]TPW72976.1 hypothetical protein FJ658_06920 [Schumannella sp. 10F1B-5-1]
MSARERGDDALAADPFSWQVTRAGVVRILRGGREVVVVGGPRAERLRAQLDRASEQEAQQLLARATGNYRRGNERR